MLVFTGNFALFGCNLRGRHFVSDYLRVQVVDFRGDVVLDLAYLLFSSFIIFSFLFHVRLQKLPLCSKLASISSDGLLQYICFVVPVLQIALDDGPFLESAHRLLRSELLHSLV